MKKSIELCGRTVCYELQRKKVKNINLRIRADGSIFVSAHRLVPQSAIDAFLKDKSAFILQALERRAEAPAASYEDGSPVPLLGKDYVLRIASSDRNRAELREDRIELCLKDKNDASKTLDSLYKRQAERLVPPLCEKLCLKMDRQMPEIRYRRMKSRWGSCTPAKGQICINSRLVTAPIECVEFVIAHELCHFLQPNHSPAFYAELAAIMPDWKERKKQLSNYGRWLA